MINTIGQYLIALVPAGTSVVTIVVAAINIAMKCKKTAMDYAEDARKTKGEIEEIKKEQKESAARERDYLQAIHSLVSENSKLHREIKELTGLIKGVKED